MSSSTCWPAGAPGQAHRPALRRPEAAVAIARSLATDPKVLLCDEATSALDPNTTASILTLLKDLNQKLGVTVVVITHQMSVIEEICSRVAILDGGVIAEQGRVEDIFSNPKPRSAVSWCIPAVSRSTGSTPHVSSASPSTAALPMNRSLPRSPSTAA